MAIYKKERAWSEKLTSAELPIAEIQRGNVAVKKRNKLGFAIPTTVNNVENVVLTPLNNIARNILHAGHYSVSLTKLSYNEVFAGVSVCKTLYWSATTGAARVEDEIILHPTSRKLYRVTRNLTSTTSFAASTYTASKFASALAAGQIEEYNMFVSNAKNYVGIGISCAASAIASNARFAFQIHGYK